MAWINLRADIRDELNENEASVPALDRIQCNEGGFITPLERSRIERGHNERRRTRRLIAQRERLKDLSLSIRVLRKRLLIPVGTRRPLIGLATCIRCRCEVEVREGCKRPVNHPCVPATSRTP